MIFSHEPSMPSSECICISRYIHRCVNDLILAWTQVEVEGQSTN